MNLTVSRSRKFHTLNEKESPIFCVFKQKLQIFPIKHQPLATFTGHPALDCLERILKTSLIQEIVSNLKDFLPKLKNPEYPFGNYLNALAFYSD